MITPGDWVETRTEAGRLVQGRVTQVFKNGKADVSVHYGVCDGGTRLENVSPRFEARVKANRCEVVPHPYS